MIELVKPDFVVGDEQKLISFISKIKKEDRVCLLSHIADMDGILSAKLGSLIVKPTMIKLVDYKEIDNKLAAEIKSNNINFLIITDLMIKDTNFIKEVEKFAEILIIDHHSFEQNFNSKRTIFFNAEGFCATYLCYYLYSKIKNLEEYDWLVASASVGDWCYIKNAKWLTKVYEKYGEKYLSDMEGITKSKFFDIVIKLSDAIIYLRNKNKINDIMKEIGSKYLDIGNLGIYAKEVEDEIKKVILRFEDEKKEINDGYYFEFESKYKLHSSIATTLSKRYLNKTMFIMWKNNNNIEFSARRQDGKVDLNLLLENLIDGFENSTAGGHQKAAGGNFPAKYEKEFTKRLKNL